MRGFPLAIPHFGWQWRLVDCESNVRYIVSNVDFGQAFDTDKRQVSFAITFLFLTVKIRFREQPVKDR